MSIFAERHVLCVCARVLTTLPVLLFVVVCLIAEEEKMLLREQEVALSPCRQTETVLLDLVSTSYLCRFPGRVELEFQKIPKELGFT